MKLLSNIVFACVFFECVRSLPTKIHPPVWEYTYQYELFEKIYRQTQSMLTDIRIISNKLSNRKCPQYWKTGDDSCYYFAFYRKLDWFKSQEACERMGGHLVIIENEEENLFVSAFTTEMLENDELAPSSLWIGGIKNSKDGTWRWITGENVTYANWKTETEISETGNRNCIVQEGEKWNVQKCSKALPYLCEKQPMIF